MVDKTDSPQKSLLKTGTWYVAHITLAATVAFIVTKDFKVAAILASAEIVWEAGLFFAHERAWAKWGKKVK